VELRQEDVPSPGPEDVRVRALASAVSHGTEMLVYRGEVPAGLALDLPTLAGGFEFPVKYGYANVGRVVERGPRAGDLEIGDAVFALHPHQSEYVLPASLVVRLPRALDPVLGVFTANLETAINVMLDAAPRLGERVLIFGQGVVGLLLVQLLRRAGVSLILAVEPHERRRALSRRFGVDAVVGPSDALPWLVQDLTNGAGADLVIEASGAGAALAQALDCVAVQGTIVVCSWYGTKTVSLPLGGAFHRRRLRIVSSQVGTIDPALTPRWTRERRLELALGYLPQLELSSLITHRFPVDRAAEAYRLVDEQAERTVQVVLTY
jgi:2-desacetyl-2-hydroxyethyl bacteriochlorophyllide A dehydrogenase